MDINKERVGTPLQAGVKLIGIGKHGSKKLSEELVNEIADELNRGNSPAILIGAFFGAIMMKGVEPYYDVLEDSLIKGALSDASLLWESLCADAPITYKAIGVKMLQKQTLSLEESTTLGDFLFSDESGESFRGMAVSILRIRYESDDEYQGLYNAIVNSNKHDIGSRNKNDKSIQLAEPFDGVEHSYMITPLIANELQKEGYSVFVSCGRSSGPKVKLNTLDVYKGLAAKFMGNPFALGESRPDIGTPFDQKVFYPNLDKWVDRRLIIMKRPFLATLEKVLNPTKSRVLITSVFHIPYLEKMATLGHMAGFKAVIVLKRGLEGSLSASLAKATGVYCSAKIADGTIVSQSFGGGHEDFTKFKIDADVTIENLSLAKNVEYINIYLKLGKTDNAEFDSRVQLSTALFKRGVQWVEEQY